MTLFPPNPATPETSPKSLGEKLAAILRGSRNAQARSLQHLETLPLGPKRSLYLVQCDGERFLIAAGADGVSAPVAVAGRGIAGRP